MARGVGGSLRGGRGFWVLRWLAALALAGSALACSGGDAPRDAGTDSALDGDDPPPCESEAQTRCGEGACVDLQGDVANCGACGVRCEGGPGATVSCVAGACRLVCEPGRADCNGVPSDGCEAVLDESRAHCGTCGLTCPDVEQATASCRDAQCALECAAGRLDCDRFYDTGCETAAGNDGEHCGACDNRCPWPPRSDFSCAEGACRFTCRAGYADCNMNGSDGCEAALVSAANCGMCGRRCGSATRYCAEQGGEITCVSTCPADTTDCDFACIRTESNLEHCGACNNRCPEVGPNAQPACVSGQCGLECRPGYADCNGDPADGCEVNLQSDPQHCGACGSTCPGGPRDEALCSRGMCRVRCQPGRLDCDNEPTTGCEVSAATDVRNCGACGRACPGGVGTTPRCAAGTCGFTCEAGFANCDGNAANGCETPTENNPRHCGACNRVCPGGTACAAGRCVPSSCPRGFGECDGNAGNGCEAELVTSLSHCGACGRACARANGLSACLGGSCVLQSCSAGFGNCDGNAANGCETPLTSVTSCGACGTRCAYANGEAECRAGRCALARCTAPFGDCDGSAANGCETNTQQSAQHCGACGRRCAAGQSCVLGACRGLSVGGDAGVDAGVDAATGDAGSDAATSDAGVEAGADAATGFDAATSDAGGSSCGPGRTECGAPSTCVDLQTDAQHCGACGRACPVGQTCALGACRCAAGQTLCGGACVDPTSDNDHCGMCGVQCTGGRSCVAGACRCPTGQTLCAGACVSTDSSAMHCGACGVACPSGQLCSGGRCGLTCTGGRTVCGSGTSMVCADLQTDRAHCGACGTACGAVAGASATACVAGRCAVTCATGRANCDGAYANGCEVDTRTSAMHCGGCAMPCPATLPGATAVACAASVCTPTCATGRGNCDGNNGNGCETDLRTSAMHCGACGNVCTGGRVCVAGACACPSGQTLCGGVCVNTQTSAAHCGACGAACPTMVSGASAVACVAGSCTPTCNAGLASCDGMAANGCEVTLATSAAHCGTCGNACPTRANSTPTCASGACGISCAMGFGNCDGNATNGCEANLLSTVAHCGRCGAACPPAANATPTCSMGACGIACAMGFADCNASRADGCEVNINTDANNCGMCGRRCAMGQSCSGGVCLATCPSGSVRVLGGSYTPVLPTGGTGMSTTVSPFCMLRYEVTVEEYRQCVTAGACAAPAGSCGVNNYPMLTTQPMNCVDVTEAKNYCAWRGGRLPTYVEWQWAARNRSAGNTYPWGNQDPLRTDMPERTCWSEASPRTGTCLPNSYSIDRSVDSIADLSGNVTEWATNGMSQCLAGGSFDANMSSIAIMRATSCRPYGSTFRFSTTGIRCAF